MPFVRKTRRHKAESADLSKREKKAVNRVVSTNLARKGIKPELKYYDVTATGVVINGTSGNMDSLITIAQGLDETNRIGDRIQVRKVEIHGIVFTGSTLNYEAGNIALVVDKQANGTSPVMNAVIGTTTAAPFFNLQSGAPLGASIIKNMNWAKRFAIKKWIKFHQNQQVASTAYISKDFKIVKSFKRPLDVEFTNTTGVVGSLGSNNIYLAYCDYNGGTASTMSYYARVYYTDM